MSSAFPVGSEPAGDAVRLAALRSYGILDTGPERGFDDIVLIASQICQAPVALVSFVESDRQWFKARVGFDPRQTPLSQSVCAHGLATPGLLVIPDLSADPRSRDNPLVTGEPYIRFYAGARLETAQGVGVGMLCVIDTVARPQGLTAAQGEALLALARQVMAQMELRRLNAQLEREIVERGAARAKIWAVTPDLLSVIRQDGRFEATNPAWGATLGWSEAELAATPFIELVVPEDVEATHAVWADAAQRGQPVLGFENRYRCKDGGWRWLSWVSVPEGDRVYCSARDVTAEHEAAEALARAEEQLRQAQKMEAIGQLTGGIAHDFNNLLTGITGSLELMQTRMAQGRAGEVERYVAAAQGAATRAAALTHRLLAFSRRQTLAPKATDLRALVDGMEDLISRSVGPGVAVTVVHAAELWPSFIDAGQLENAILNLCINARDAMPEGGTITVETANCSMGGRAAAACGLEPGPYVSVCVSDTGVGMTPDVAARVFEPFFTTKPIGMGTGLGLSMVHGFAKQSGGAVGIRSEVGGGTRVCIYLPRHHGPAVAAAVGVGRRDAPRAGAGETVLVVDDEPTVRMLIADVLAELGYVSIEAGDGAAGLRVVNSDMRIDLLVTDVGLPGGMNGREMAEAARAVRPGLKVLFITGYAETAWSEGQLGPRTDLLTKPFGMDVLAGRIRGLIGEA